MRLPARYELRTGIDGEHEFRLPSDLGLQDVRESLDRVAVESWPFLKWDTYSGLALEPSDENVCEWLHPEGKTYDLTFRSLLILHYAGLL